MEVWPELEHWCANMWTFQAAIPLKTRLIDSGASSECAAVFITASRQRYNSDTISCKVLARSMQAAINSHLKELDPENLQNILKLIL